MARLYRAVVAALCLLPLAAGAARGHSEEMPTAELLDTVAAAGGPELAYPDATVGAPPASRVATPAAWYSRTPVAARFGSSDDNSYSLAGGCFRMWSEGGGYLARSGDEYLTGARADDAEVFRFQATGLATYLLLGSDGGFAAPTADGPGVLEEPAGRAEWTVRGSEASGYQLVARTGEALGIDRDGGLELGGSERFELRGAPSCMSFPEIAVNATGRPYRATPRYGEASGMIDLHSHMMAFEAFGRGLHCGRPWHPLGVESALQDCPYHAPNGIGALETNLLVFQDPLRMHDPDGWPTFAGWPHKDMVFGHEQTYYRWIERAWRGGLRLVTLLAVDNSAACLINTHKTESCNEMEAVRRQIAATKEMQAYIDAQAGGPGKGYFRIVRNPFQARKVINDGKLAVVLGIEVSEPLDCGIRNGVPQCNEEDVDEELDAVFASGVRQMEIVNKFDNAFTGVAMDGGFQGPVINLANKQVTGEFWEVETCTGSDADNTQVTSVTPEAAALIALLPGGAAQLPVYPAAPHCNTRGLTELGRHLIRGMAKRKMIFDPDHMSVYARSSALDLIDALNYSGIVSSHSWADRTSYRRIMELGGVVTPMAPDADDFDDRWASQRELYREGKRRSRKYGFGIGLGDDMNGFGGPREPTGGTDAEISYPFNSPIHRSVTLDRQQSGTRTFDLNTDGIAHFGQWPDWTEGVRRDGGSRVIRDLRGGAEAYLRMWERAVGIRGPHRKGRHAHFKPTGVKRIKLGARPTRLLRKAGQPDRRTRGWRWRTRGARGSVGAAFVRGKVGLVAATARGYAAAGIHKGTPGSRLTGFAEHLGAGIWVRDAGKASRFVYGVRGGKVRLVGVGTERATDSGKRIKRLARLAAGR